MKKQLQLKHKVMIGVGAGLLGATAIATPLAITLTRKDQNSMDAKYGINKKSYNNMKLDLQNKYEAEMLRQGLDQPTRTKRMGDLNHKLTYLDEHITKLMNSNSSNNAYTAGTSVLMMESAELGVNLERKSRANWSEVQQMYNGMCDSFETYMQNHSFDRSLIKTVLNNAEKSYNDMMKQIKASYANDVLGGVLKAKTRLISCFDSINTEIAKLAACIRLNEFISNYTFSYRVDAKTYSKIADKDMNRIDQLRRDKLLVEDEVISKNTMNKIFKVFNNETRQTVEFSPSMIPGYTLAPKFKEFKVDNYSNQQSISIDWQLVSDNVEESSREAATAHLVDVNENLINDALDKEKVKSYTDFFELADQNIKLSDYSVFRTSKEEVEGLQEAYFNSSTNGSNIKLVWQDNDAVYDGFMFIDQTQPSGTLNMRQLAYTNVYVQNNNEEPELLKNVIARVNQDNYEPKTVVEKFVKYCDVKANVTLTHNTNDVSDVSCDFVASYKNESNWEDVHFQKTSTDHQFQEKIPAQSCIDNGVSDQFFESVNNAFNDSYKHSELFIDNRYEDIALRSHRMNVVAGMSVAMNALNVATVGFYAIVKCASPDGSGVFWLIQSLILGIVLAFQCESWYEIKEYFNDPIVEYENKANEFTGEGTYEAVAKMLAEDKDTFALKDKDGNVDEKEFADKMAKFRDLEKEDQQALAKRYMYFETTDPGKTFFAEAKRLGIDPEKFNEDFGDWKAEGFRMIFVLLCNALTFFWIGISYMLLETAKKSYAAWAADAQMAQGMLAENEANQVASGAAQAEVAGEVIANSLLI